MSTTAFASGGLVVRCRSLVKVYRTAESEVQALQGLDLDLEAGEVVGVVGASGSGKSTLLGVLGGLVAPTAGSIESVGVDLLAASDRRRSRYRRTDVGFLWQHSHQNLLDDLTARENISRSIEVAGGDARARPDELLDLVGLADSGNRRPATLSGGEQARVALAVALAHRPRLLLADEPTGELDTSTSHRVFELIRRAAADEGVTSVVVSHDRDVVDHVDRVIGLRDGRFSTESRRSQNDDRPATDTVVVDAAGRLQLPPDVVDQVGIGHRVRITVEDGAAVVRPVDDPSSEDPPVDDAQERS